MSEMAYRDGVAALDDDAFELAAHHVAAALKGGDGLRMHFQPGDATKYILVVGARRTLVVSNGEPMPQRRLDSVANVDISFGTDSDMMSMPMGHASRLNPTHPWTNAVWKRLWATLLEQYPMGEW